MTTVKPTRVAMLATPFGFGPASKAYSIGSLLADKYGIDVYYFGSGSALDFFAAQDLCAHGLASPVREHDLDATKWDAMVNVLAPELIFSSEIAALTHYVDSLGFMWQDADLPPYSLLRRVRGYYAQDLFGSAQNLGRLGIRDIIPVSGIVARQANPSDHHDHNQMRAVVNLGGLGNPAGTSSARAYLALVKQLLPRLQESPYDLTVAMNLAIGDLSTPSVPARQFSGAGFLGAMAACDVVFSSPGMTTLVETSRAARAYVPLPPQNWSQVVISEHMAAQSDLELWPFLSARYYGIGKSADETHKAAAVREVNLNLTADTGFVADYGVLALRAANAAEVPRIGAPFDGAHKIAAAVAADVGACAGSVPD